MWHEMRCDAMRFYAKAKCSGRDKKKTIDKGPLRPNADLTTPDTTHTNPLVQFFRRHQHERPAGSLPPDEISLPFFFFTFFALPYSYLPNLTCFLLSSYQSKRGQHAYFPFSLCSLKTLFLDSFQFNSSFFGEAFRALLVERKKKHPNFSLRFV